MTILNLNHCHLILSTTPIYEVSGEFSQILKHLCPKTIPTSLLSVKPTCMTTSRTLISNCLATCRSIRGMLGICTALVFMLRAIFQLIERLFLRMKTSLICVFIWHFYILLPYNPTLSLLLLILLWENLTIW